FNFNQVLQTFTQKVAGFIEKQSRSSQPFFLYFPMPAPHTPWLPDPKHTGKSGAGTYGDYVQQTDEMVGQILLALERAGVSDNTMVVFTSDNGPYWREEQIRQYNHFSAGDWRGMKGDAFEGGHRVPFIVRYPGKVAAGSVSDTTISLTILITTCIELTGCKNQAFEAVDSYSILPVLTGRA